LNKDWLVDIELEGESVILIPLHAAHSGTLVEAAMDGELWKLWYTSVPSEKSIHDYIAFALNQKALKRSLPFVALDSSTRRVIGSTRFCNVEPEHRRVEIGYTWYAKRFQRTSVNTECKYLLLRHAFESLNVIAVEFRTHWQNLSSRNAIARLGAKQDGVLRNHRKDKHGSYRDTVIFSILDNEWPTVKKDLSFKLTDTSK
jgi:RimJ/RimL family protein N-acetyltransferase